MAKGTMKYIGKGLEEKKEKKAHAKVYLIKDRCKGCNFCIEFCPKQVLVESKEFNIKGYYLPELVEIPGEKECVGCGYCSFICPEFAIFAELKDEEEH